MPTTFTHHTWGPVVPMASVGVDYSYVPIGVCEDGAEITFNTRRRGVRCDGAGGPDGAPAEYLFLNSTVSIRFTVVPFNEAVVMGLRACSMATPTDGKMGMPGTTYGLNGFLPGLYLPTINVLEAPWWFPCCLVNIPGDNQPRAGQLVKPTFEFIAMNYLDQWVPSPEPPPPVEPTTTAPPMTTTTEPPSFMGPMSFGDTYEPPSTIYGSYLYLRTAPFLTRRK